MTIKIKSAKAKGRACQKWVCEKIGMLLNLPWGRDELIAPREMGQSGTDVRLVGKALKEFPFSVECKWQETWSVGAWIEQAKSNMKSGTDWLLILKRRNERYVAVLDADVFFNLLERRRNGGGED